MSKIGDFLSSQLMTLVLGFLTPALRVMLQDFAFGFFRKARETPNPYDDVGAAALLSFLGLDSPVDPPPVQ